MMIAKNSNIRGKVHSPSILLAEDDDDMRDVLVKNLRQDGYSVTECRDGVELLSHLDGYLKHEEVPTDAEQYDLIISDVRMPGVFGSSVVEGANVCASFPPTILITAFPDTEIYESAKNCGVLAVLSKPFEVGDLVSMVRESVGQPKHAG